MSEHVIARAATKAGPKMAPDLLPLCTDMLVLWDAFAGVSLGLFNARCTVWHVSFGIMHIEGALMREIILGSIIAGLIMRDLHMAMVPELRTPQRLVLRLGWRAAAACGLLLFIGVQTRAAGDSGRLWIAGWCGLFFISICLSRLLLLAHLHRLATHGGLREAVAVIGASDIADRLATRLGADANIVRIIDDGDEFGAGSGLASSGQIAELLELACTGAVDTIVVALHPDVTHQALRVLQRFKSAPVQLAVCSDLAFHAACIEIVPAPRPTTVRVPKLRVMGGVPISVLADRPLHAGEYLAKTTIDKAGALLLLLMALPLMLLVAMAIALDSSGPIIFRQRRSGWGGRLFTIYKFRTMRHEPSPALHQTERGDRRFTRVGALLRRSSLDELPQLLNVLRGDMSLVGPRPHADVLHAAERDGCAMIADYAQRHRMKPGLTGWAQINGARGAVRTTDALRRRLSFDLYYIENWSIWLDIRILARTPRTVLFGENAF